MATYLVKNSKHKECKRCGTVHPHLTRRTDNAPCDTPVAFSFERAKQMSNLHAGGFDDVIETKETDVVVIDDSARKLPVRGAPKLKRFDLIEQLA